VSGSVQEYGYLALRRDYGGVFTLPDGKKEFFDQQAEAEASRQKWIAEKVLPNAERKVEEKRRVFAEGCRVQEERLKQPGLLTSDRILQNVLDADGTYLGEATAEDFLAIVEKAALKKFPDPIHELLASGATGAVEKQVVWAAGLYLGGTFESLPAIWTWNFGLPIEDALRILNDLAAEGWRVVSVSEDRGIYRGATNQTDSAVTTVRYLLARELPAGSDAPDTRRAKQ
jgi:hypothetical protein